jgi:hypothetical protein
MLKCLLLSVKYNCYITDHNLLQYFLFFFLWYWSLNSGTTSWATPPTLSCDLFFFEIRSHELFARGWLQTVILLISTSWVSRLISYSSVLTCLCCFIIIANTLINYCLFSQGNFLDLKFLDQKYQILVTLVYIDILSYKCQLIHSIWESPSVSKKNSYSTWMWYF